MQERSLPSFNDRDLNVSHTLAGSLLLYTSPSSLSLLLVTMSSHSSQPYLHHPDEPASDDSPSDHHANVSSSVAPHNGRSPQPRTSSSHKPVLTVVTNSSHASSSSYSSTPHLPSPDHLQPRPSAWYLPFGTDDLSPSSVLFYSLGHVLNDLCAACWFTYLLVMLRDARNITSWKSALILLAGQVADAIATPVVGILSDRSSGLSLWRLRLERRQTWYLFGSVLVAINFFLLFGIALPVLINPDCPEWGLLAYYCTAASLFNVGWASVQVSHMSMVPELSRHEHTRVVLNSARYSESVVANVAVFGILACWAAVFSRSEQQYTFVSYTTLSIGLACSLAFLFGIREKPARRRRPLALDDALSTPSLSPSSPSPPSSPGPASSSTECCGGVGLRLPVGGWRVWLHNRDFYKVGWVYMNTRLVVNVSQVFLAFYVLDTLQMPTVYITIIPCVVYVSSFLAALGMKRVNKSFGRRVITAIGTAFCTLALVLLYFLHPETAQLIYVPAVLLGIGNGTIMVMSTQLEADLIGRRTEHGAFVYGALSFTDKLANGLAIFFLQAGNKDMDDLDDISTSDAGYIRLSVVALPFVASVLAMAMVLWGIDIDAMIEHGNDVSHLDEEEEDGHAAAHSAGQHPDGSGMERDAGYKPPALASDGDVEERNGNGLHH